MDYPKATPIQVKGWYWTKNRFHEEWHIVKIRWYKQTWCDGNCEIDSNDEFRGPIKEPEDSPGTEERCLTKKLLCD